MKLLKTVFLLLVFLLSACGTDPAGQIDTLPTEQSPTAPTKGETIHITLSDSGVTVDGEDPGTDSTAVVYTANDIVYYESGKDFTYGEGSQKDAHTQEEAAAHTVVHITKPGVYSLSGKLSRGQIAVDLGDDAKKNSSAVVTLILNGVDITCEVAPAVIFYDVYECGNDDIENASKDVDTSAAGANVIIADGTVNTVNGSYVARIYEPDSVVLNEDKTEVEDAKKLHKYDGAFYSKRSLNIFGEKENTGILNIKAENEGLDSELHLTINGGNINIQSGNDGINTNEDGVSVTTINGGKLTIQVTGQTGEGDGIDSNGWLVVNGGWVTAAACSDSADAGIDSDMGIHINGGTVIATGHMLDRIQDGGQTYAVFNFAEKQTGSEMVILRDKDGNTILETKPENGYSVLIYSSSHLKTGTYTLWSDGKQLAGSAGGAMNGPGMQPGGVDRPEEPDNMQRPVGGQEPPDGFGLPEDVTLPEGFVPPEGEMSPEGFTPPQGDMPPEGFDGNRPEMPNGNRPNGGNLSTQALLPEFAIRDGMNTFSNVSIYEESQ